MVRLCGYGENEGVFVLDAYVSQDPTKSITKPNGLSAGAGKRSLREPDKTRKAQDERNG